METSDRHLATILFTDIVDSTRRAAELGDRRWRDALQEHDAFVRREIAPRFHAVAERMGLPARPNPGTTSD